MLTIYDTPEALADFPLSAKMNIKSRGFSGCIEYFERRFSKAFWVFVFQVVIRQLRSDSGHESHHQHWKAARALLIILPLLGTTYLITLFEPQEPPIATAIFRNIRALLLSTQVKFHRLLEQALTFIGASILKSKTINGERSLVRSCFFSVAGFVI